MVFINSSLSSIELHPGDIVLVRGSSWISRLIRIATRHIGEKRTKVNHVGMIVVGGKVSGRPRIKGLTHSIGDSFIYHDPCIIEAISRVKVRNLYWAYGPPNEAKIAIYRATNLKEEEIDQIVEDAYSHLGKHYGWKRIVCLALDRALLGAYVFRRLIRNREPVCSWLVAHAYSKVSKHFGVGPDSATPDDIWDFVAEKQGTPYVCVYPLGRLE